MTPRSFSLLAALLSGTMLMAAGIKATPAGTPGPTPAEGRSGRGLTPKGGCAVCGMQVANFPDWAAVITFRDGAQAWFDGPKDLFTFLLDLKQYAPKRQAGDITAIQVKDYYALKHVDGRKAFYVTGSDVMGPMGKELVPFATEAAARDFLKDHHGRQVLTFPQVTSGVMAGLQ
jgi:nitrous oxide reductase accessory protein NosL